LRTPDAPPATSMEKHAVLSSAVAAGHVGGVGSFFNGEGDGFGDAFVEHGRNDVFGMELEG
jgi:hypothetical protein